MRKTLPGMSLQIVKLLLFMDFTHEFNILNCGNDTSLKSDFVSVFVNLKVCYLVWIFPKKEEGGSK